MFVWMTLIAVTIAAWQVAIPAGLLGTFILLLTFLSRLEAVAPSRVVIAAAVLLLLSAFVGFVIIRW